MTPTPSIQRQYDEIVAAIVKFQHPDAICTGSMWFSKEGGDGLYLNPDSSNLEDVLRAWPRVPEDNLLLTKGRLCFFCNGDDAEWHLGKTLEAQPEETKLFLHSVLCD